MNNLFLSPLPNPLPAEREGKACALFGGLFSNCGLQRPHPVGYFITVGAVLVRIGQFRMISFFICSFRCAALAASPGTRSMASITRLKRSVWLRIASSSGRIDVAAFLVAAHMQVL